MRRLRSNALFALPSVGSGRPAGLADTGVAGAAAYSLNDGNVPQRKRLAIAEPSCEPCLFAGGKAPRTQPRRTNLAVSWSEDPGGGPRIVGDPRWVETDERNAPQIAFGGALAALDGLLQVRGTTAPSGRRSRTQVTRSRLCRRWLSSSWPTPHAHAATLCDRPNRDRVGRLGWVELHHDRNLFVPD